VALALRVELLVAAADLVQLGVRDTVELTDAVLLAVRAEVALELVLGVIEAEREGEGVRLPVGDADGVALGVAQAALTGASAGVTSGAASTHSALLDQ
jgi:hypothetical protein